MKHVLSLLTALVLLAGCTTFKKSIAAVDVTVEHAMQGWGEHVASERAKTPPNLLLRERAEVKKIYERYQVELDRSRIIYNEAARTGAAQDYETALKSIDAIHAQLVELIWIYAPQLKIQP